MYKDTSRAKGEEKHFIKRSIENIPTKGQGEDLATQKNKKSVWYSLCYLYMYVNNPHSGGERHHSTWLPRDKNFQANPI